MRDEHSYGVSAIFENGPGMDLMNGWATDGMARLQKSQKRLCLCSR